ncbi:MULTISPECIES: hypothetical protein [unclassified Streptomyces]|uniref:WD40 repeat domain-containing protein n=1 Tax=unclassified Streptomyces TaxID=2593676 RepID=UPI0024757FFA|nr:MULTISPECIES: hypothetical protein [unclassified Streptomyces]
MAFSPDFRTLTSAGADHTVRLWSVVTRRQLPVLAGHTDYANDVAATGRAPSQVNMVSAASSSRSVKSSPNGTTETRCPR